MEYPNRLLPKPQYKRIHWHESLRNHFLIHFTDQKDIRDPNTNKLHIKHVVKRTDHLRDYSTNLLGIFLVDDIYWALQDCPDKDYFMDEWEEGTEVKKPKVPGEYDREENPRSHRRDLSHAKVVVSKEFVFGCGTSFPVNSIWVVAIQVLTW